MTSAVETLFHQASEQSFHPYLNTPEYEQYANEEDRAEEKLRKLLSPEQLALLEAMSSARNYCCSIEQEAAFQAGLATGLELSRL